jgi:hypothetical protein
MSYYQDAVRDSEVLQKQAAAISGLGVCWTPWNQRSPGYPQDHSAEDTFDIPPFPVEPVKINAAIEGNTWPEASDASELSEDKEADAAFLSNLTDTLEVTQEYSAEFTTRGGVQLILTTTSKTHTVRPIASFDTFADAQLAAEALNNHNGF